MDINVIIEQIQPVNKESAAAAQNRFDNLIKPVGSLAKLESMVARYAGIIGSADKKAVQYPKKALLLWSTDVAAIAAAMGGRASGGLTGPRSQGRNIPTAGNWGNGCRRFGRRGDTY